ncbi:MAG TPA: hypothetical protein VJS43_04040 [Candidatus Acidoferrales bacterium]|nr:hypothetical protein [Candidatus Acidoferrales bacterium]
MKIEYLADGAPECPLIRLYDFDQVQARKLRGLIASMVAGERQSVALQDEKWAEPLAGCHLALCVGSRNNGVRQASGLRFEWVLNLDGWSNVERLLKPFSESDTDGIQWLNDSAIAVLISRNGHW